MSFRLMYKSRQIVGMYKEEIKNIEIRKNKRNHNVSLEIQFWLLGICGEEKKTSKLGITNGNETKISKLGEIILRDLNYRVG